MYCHYPFQDKICCPLECTPLSLLTSQGQNPLSIDQTPRQLHVMDLTLSVLALSWKKMVIHQAGAGKHFMSTEFIHSLTHKNTYPYDLFHFEEDSLLQRA